MLEGLWKAILHLRQQWQGFVKASWLSSPANCPVLSNPCDTWWVNILQNRSMQNKMDSCNAETTAREERGRPVNHGFSLFYIWMGTFEGWGWVSHLFSDFERGSPYGREAWLFFRAGKAQDSWFDYDDLVIEVNKAIDILEGKTNGFATGLFSFDNAPSHQKQAQDALCTKNAQGPTCNLATSQGWTENAYDNVWREQDSPGFVLSWQPWDSARVVQRDGTDYTQARSLAWLWAQCTGWRLQVHDGEDRLLLLVVIIHAAWFCQPEVSPGRTDNILRSHLWLLPKIPLWIEFYRAVLGSSKVPLLHKPKDRQHQRDGRECESMSQQCAHSSNQMVWHLFPCLSASNHKFSSDMPTDWPILSMHTHWVCQALRLCGQIENIMAIGASHLIFLLTWRRNLKRNMVGTSSKMIPV